MKMNHRWGFREPLERPVQIWQRGARGVRAGRSRDMSFDGIFIAAPMAVLYPGTLVDLIATRHMRGVTWTMRMSAVVARLTDEGVGLMFTMRDPGEIVRFTELVRASGSLLRVRPAGSYYAFTRRSRSSGVVLSMKRGQKTGMPARACDPVGDRKLMTGENHEHDKAR